MGRANGPAAASDAPHSSIVAFVALTYAISWAWWVPLIASGEVVTPGSGWPTHLPGLMGPALAAVVLTAVRGGPRALRELWSRTSRWRVGWVWYAVIAATAALALLPLAAGTTSDPDSLLVFSGAPEVGLWVVPYVILINGLGEEVGWRGYLAEHLLRTRSRAVTSLVVWPIWALWHLPLFWVLSTFRDFGIGGTIGWVVGIGFGSVFLTWLYDSALHSILVVALWHTAYNFCTATEAAAGAAAAAASTLVIIASVVILRRPASWQRPGASGG